MGPTTQEMRVRKNNLLQISRNLCHGQVQPRRNHNLKKKKKIKFRNTRHVPNFVHCDEEDKPKKTNGSHNQIKEQVNMNASPQSFCHSKVTGIFKTLNKRHHSPV